MTDRITLDELTTSMAESVAIDEALFAEVGKWSTEDRHVAHRAVFVTVSRWLGEHAVALRALLADSPALVAAERIVVPDDWAERLVHLEETEDRVGDLRSVLVARRERDRALTATLHEVSDRPLMRHLHHTSIDLVAAEDLLSVH